jgi:SAM-dependent methyltransferase
MNIKRAAHWLYGRAAHIALKPLLYAEWKTQRGEQNERVTEYAYALSRLARQGGIERILDIGSGDTSFPHLLSRCGYKVDAIDNWADFWKYTPPNRHFHVIGDDITDPKKVTAQYDAITCISTLEHLENHDAALQHIAWLLRRGGHFILTTYVTDKQYRYDTYQHGLRDYITKSFTSFQVELWRQWYFGYLCNEEHYIGFTGDYWNEGDRISPPWHTKTDDYNLGCFHFIRTKEWSG